MKCPNCGDERNFDVEPIETEYEGHCYYDYMIGTCLTCGKQYEWTEIFTFSHATEPREINPNDHL